MGKPLFKHPICLLNYRDCKIMKILKLKVYNPAGHTLYLKGGTTNKSAAGMHHTLPRNNFNAKTIHKSRAITQLNSHKKLNADFTN